MTDQTQDYTGWIGHEVTDTSGAKVGKVSSIFLDDETGQPEWLAVSTGMFAKRSSFVPLQGATSSGDQLVVAYDKDKIKGAPQVDDDGDGHLTPAEEEELYRYYDASTASAGTEQATGTVAAGQETSGTAAVGRDTSGPSTDDAMTRSEEEVRVGTRVTEAGRARLRKYIVTEQVTQTVPVSHEEIRIEREPITDANRGAATSGPELSEEEHEVVLHAETPVVEKTVVPVERVRLATETVTGEETVTTDVRKEQIEEVEVEPTDRTGR